MKRRSQCPTCQGAGKVVCTSCKGTKESQYHGVEICELCDSNAEQPCFACGSVGLEKAASFDQIIAWYSQGERDFTEAKFDGGRRSYSDLDLREINLSNASLSQYQFLKCDFSKADLHGVNFREAFLQQCKFDAVNLTSANMQGSELSNSSFSGANLSWANLSKARLTTADFSRASLTEADLSDAVLRDVPFEEADLRRVKGLRLDSNFVRGARFSPGAGDPWSMLRRKYTGPMFAFHFFVLICFLLPYGLRTAYWVSVNETQTIATSAGRQISDRLDRVAAAKPGAPLPADSVFAAVVQTINEFKGCFSSECRSVPIWQLLVGLDRGLATALLPFALLLYNFCRAVLTWRVTLLREEEERSGYAPAFASYGWLYQMHRAYSLLYVGAIGILAWHLYTWLTMTVSLQG